MNRSSLNFFQKFNIHNKSSRKNLHELIFKRKNLQNHIPKEKTPMNKSSIKISKTSMEKYLRINLQGKISMNKSSLKIFKSLISRINLQGKISTNKSSKGKSPFFKGKISMNKSSKGKISND